MGIIPTYDPDRDQREQAKREKSQQILNEIADRDKAEGLELGLAFGKFTRTENTPVGGSAA